MYVRFQKVSSVGASRNGGNDILGARFLIGRVQEPITKVSEA